MALHDELNELGKSVSAYEDKYYVIDAPNEAVPKNFNS